MRIQFQKGMRRWLSLLLALTMLLPNFPVTAFGQNPDADDGTICGIPAHTHSDACFQTVAVCGFEEGAAHTHSDGCFETVSVLICGQEETPEHPHAEECYEMQTQTVCGLDDVTPHTHGEACFQSEPVQVCTLAEHVHDSACYPAVKQSKAATRAAAVDLSGYTETLHVYNYIRYSNSDNTNTGTIEGTLALTTGDKTFDFSMLIGGHTDMVDDAERKPMSNDISLAFNGLQMGGVVTVAPVFPENPGAYKTSLNITGNTILGGLTLAKNAVMEITLNAPLTIQGDLVLGENSMLTIHAGEQELKLESVSGTGSLVLNNGIVNVTKNISCDNLTVSGTTLKSKAIHAANALTIANANLDAPGETITASGSITATNAAIADATLFGVKNAARSVTMRFTGITFNNVKRVGAAEDCTANVYFDGCSVNGEAESYCQDFTITYQADGITDPSHYRVTAKTLAGSEAIIVGNPALPHYEQPGYNFIGWKISGSEEVITQLADGTMGNLVLSPVSEANDINVTMDLMFLPADDNCDDVDRWNTDFPLTSETNTRYATQSVKLGSSITLVTPQRFGYIFAGWQLKGTQTILNDTLLVSLDKLTDAEASTLALEAVWQKDTFPLYWTFSTDVPLEFIQMSVDGGATWFEPEDLGNYEAYSEYWEWHGTENLIRSRPAGEIIYGETLGAYMKRLGSSKGQSWQFPIVRDTRFDTNDPAAQAFLNWSTRTPLIVSGESTYDVSASGFLVKPADSSWANFQNNLLPLSDVLTLTANFGTANYKLKIPAAAQSKWTFQVDGKGVVPVDGVLTVPNGAKVTFACGNNDGLSICNWEFVAQNHQAINPVERVYDGKTKYYYDFTMPACDVNTFYQTSFGAKYVNIANGAITFVEAEDPAGTGILRDGFWHQGRLVSGTSEQYRLPLLGMTPLCYDAQKGYFYVWNMSNALYVTSDGTATTNQLTLVKTATVYLNTVNLIATEAFKANAVGRRIYGESMEKPYGSSAAGGMAALSQKIEAKGGLAPLGNIVLADDALVSQTFTLHFIGENNYVGAIFSDQYYESFNNVLHLYGTEKDVSKLQMGTAFGNFSIVVENITLEEDKVLACGYLLHASVDNANVSIRNARVDAPHKEVYVKGSNLTIGVDGKASAAAVVDVGMVLTGNQLIIYTSSRLRVRGDAFVGYTGIVVGSDTVTVIDGNYSIKYFHWSGTYNKGGKNAVLIVKGNRCELGNTWWTSGTLVCNALVLGRAGGVKGGTVIANQILNDVGKHWNIASGSDVYTYVTEGSNAVTSNGDNHPFQTYTRTDSGHAEYTFSGGEVYLLGYYEVANGAYDTSVTVAYTPVAALLDTMLDTDGNYNGNVAPTDQAKTAVQSGQYKNEECIVLGGSNLNTATNSRIVNIGGNAKIFAAGHLNFFNDVNVSENAAVWCGGTFGSKNEMHISGGSIIAREVGISYKMTTKLDDGTIRWKKLTVDGGSITTDRIGTLSGYAYDSSVEVRGAAQIDPACVQPLTSNGSVAMAFDAYVNYLLGTSGFTNPADNKNLKNVRISGTLQNGTVSYGAEEVYFAAPVYDGGIGQWKLNSTEGVAVDGVNADADLICSGTALSSKAYDQDRLILVAVKTAYNVTVQTGLDYITDLNGQGKTDQISANAGSTVTIQLTDAQLAADKTVVWFADANGNLCNPEYTANGNTVAFPMPYYDVDVFVAPDGIDLDLSKYHVTITADGFHTKLEDTIDNREFHYLGDLNIKQSVSGATNHLIRILADVDNLNDGRVFTLHSIRQASSTEGVGLKLEDGAKARVKISGNVLLCRVEVPEHAEILLEGVERNYDVNKLLVTAGSQTAVVNKTAFGNFYGKAGNITVKDLNLLPKEGSTKQFDTWGYGTAANTTNTVAYIGCYMDIPIWYSSSYLAYNAGTVVIEDCDFDIETASTWPSPLLGGSVQNFVITRSRLNFLNMGAASGNDSTYKRTLAYGVKVQFTITDSIINTTLRNSEASNNYKVDPLSSSIAPTVVLRGNTVYNAEPRTTFNTLILEGNSTFNVGGADKDGYLFAKNIQVKENAKLNAGTVLVSGYLTNKYNTIEKVKETLASTNPALQDGKNGGLFISGGTVNADAVGGDVNTVVSVIGGVLSADKIGTMGAVYGYGLYTPEPHENWVESHARIPEGATVNISGGTVNVSEYLGGMKSTVNITGGKVNLAENAVLGMTDAQRDTLKAHYDAKGVDIDKQTNNINVSISGGNVEGDGGTINVPYGTLNVSGAQTGVKVQNILAHYGDITIRDANNAYDNLNIHADHKKVGVYVSGDLNGQNIHIIDGAVVYAQNAIATAPLAGDTTILAVPNGSTPGALYANTMGTAGSGTGAIEGVEKITLFPQSNQFSIWYELNDDAIDPANNDLNQDSFVYIPGNPVILHESTRYGYDFMGWYLTQEAAQRMNPEEALPSQIYPDGDLTIYAAWAPKMVQFQIHVDGNDFTSVGVDLASEYAKLPAGTADYDAVNNILTFKKIVSVPYREQIRGTSEKNINLSDLALGAFVTNAIAFADAPLSGEIQAGTTVTRQILDVYTDKNQGLAESVPVILKVTQLIKKNEDMTLHLNQTAGRPVDAHFQGHPVGENTLTGSAIVGNTISTADALMVGDKLNQPVAPGYTFAGWYTSENIPIDEDYPVGNGNALDFYAKWEKNQYKICFDSNGGYVTTNAERPDESTAPAMLETFVSYDTVINGNLSYGDGFANQNLPFAWKPGYKFSHWEADGKRIDGQELNQKTFASISEDSLEKEMIVSGSDVAQLNPILTLEAVYTPITVTYNTDGGTFTEVYQNIDGFAHVSGDTYTSQTNGDTVAYGKPLAGYSQNANGEFVIISTTAEYFDLHKDYLPNDYRKDLGRKGWTFQGWKDENGNFVQTLPAYEDVELQAYWKANSYKLILNAQDAVGSQYSKIIAENPAPDPNHMVSVTVGEVIDGTVPESDAANNWPNRVDSWYAVANSDQEAALNKRNVLGFTFDFLDPGAPGELGSPEYLVYNRYASDITTLINQGTLFTKKESIPGSNVPTEGSVFFLPEAEQYHGDGILINKVQAVPDYPDGSQIPMYAVYRERSVVFIERYVDLDGKTQEKVLTSESYLVHSEFANDYPDAVADRFDKMGYTFVYWSVNHPQDGYHYPSEKSAYTAELYERWLTDANSLGRYDINVYTVYAAQVESDITLETAQDPSAEHAVVKEYLIPGSMTVKNMIYSVSDKTAGLQIGKDANDLQPYDPNHINEVAIFVELVNSSGEVKTAFWLDGNATNVPVGIGVGAGWKIRMTMYHSKVIPANHSDLSFHIQIGFQDNSGTIDPNQKIDLLTTINMQPARWTVNYNVNLPADEPYRTILDENGFSFVDMNTRKKTDVNWTYGAPLLSELPELEGFQPDDPWKDSAGNAVTPDTIEITGSGPINLYSGYVRNSYTLTDLTDGKCTVTNPGQTPYHAQVTLTPGSTPASFIWLRYNGAVYRLDQLREYDNLFHGTVDPENGSYTFLMPPGDVEVVYDDVMELYLGYGTIDIDAGSYTQNEQTVSWTGNYRILQWPESEPFVETANVLNLAGNLSDRTVTLGRLNITTENSIALAADTTVKMQATESVIAKNILVPETATLSLDGSASGTAMTLSPVSGNAAIGGGAGGVGGMISVSNLNLTANMPAGSVASVIGSGNALGSSTVTVNNCGIFVYEGYTINDGAYRGTWFGGKNAVTVSINGSTIAGNNASDGAAICDGATVTINDCSVGSQDSRLAKHPMRGDNLFVNDSQIYLNSDGMTVLSPGTTMHVDQESAADDIGSKIDVINSYNLYNNQLKIYSAKSDVVVNGYRLLDLKNGDVEIANAGSAQGGVMLNNTGKYQLLNAFDSIKDLTVNGSAEIFTENTCKIDKLSINADATLMPLGTVLPVNTVQIAEGKTLTVDADDGTGLSVSASFGGEGNYTQKDGTLSGSVDLTVSGNMELSDVTVLTQNKKVGSLGSEGKVTIVTIDGGSVLASTIGAIGAQSQTFTFVTLQNNPVITGTLVQDHYRLHYNLADSKFQKDAAGIPVDEEERPLPTVLRSSTAYSNGIAASNIQYQPDVPDNPKYTGTGTSYFGCWYLLDGENKIGLGTKTVAGMDSMATLSKELVSYAAETATDGTQTLELYDWMAISGTGMITYGRELNEVTATEKTVAIETNGAWTARFNVIGAGSEEAGYVFNFENAIPAKTKLTLSYWENGQPVYCSYITSGAVKKVTESDFVRMGSTVKADLIPSTGDFEAVLQLSADFQDAPASANSISLSVQMGQDTYPIDQVGYTVKQKVEASCNAGDANITYQVTTNGDNRLKNHDLYLVAQIQKDGNPIAAPYDAVLKLDDTAGTWLGGNIVYFELGNFEQITEITKPWSITGLPGGDYTVKWYLTAAKANAEPNVFDTVLAESASVTLTVEQIPVPELSVILLDPVYVLSAETAHALRFQYTANGTVSAQLEKQNRLQLFSAVAQTIAAQADDTVVTIPAEAGVYRVRFSLDGFGTDSSMWDDVYFTFIVKAGA